MGKGARAPAEFIQGVPRRYLAPSRPPQSPELQTAQHIDLRIRRQTAVPQTMALKPNPQWHLFLDDLGRTNNMLGQALSLGSTGITYIKATEFNSMLQDKYPREFADPRRKMKLFRNVSAGMTAYMRAEGRAHKEQLHVDAFIASREMISASAVPNANSDIFIQDNFDYDDESENPQVDAMQQCEHMFGPATLAVKGLNLYGRNHIGVDLSLNERLYDERSSLVTYLAASEKLNTTMIDHKWKPHATIFNVLPHLVDTQLVSANIPDIIALESPKVARLPE